METPALLSFETSNAPRVRTILWCGLAAMLGIAGLATGIVDDDRDAAEPMAQVVESMETPLATSTMEHVAAAMVPVQYVEEDQQEELASNALPLPRERVAKANFATAAVLEGMVHLPSAMSPEEAEAVQLEYTVRGETRVAALDGLGGFGPLELAPGQRFTEVRLEGGGLVPEERRLEVASGRPIELDFHPDLGHDLWFFVADSLGEPIADARLTLEVEGDQPAPRGNLEPRKDGYVRFRGLAPGSIYVRSGADGSATRRDGPFEVPGANEAIWIELQDASALSGRVTAAGEPLSDFEVVWWSAGAPATHVTTPFHRTTDGTFSLEDVVAGPIYVTAQGEDLPPCAPVLVDTASDEGELRLELGAGVRITGRVIGGFDEAPLAQAELGLSSGEGQQPAAGWGPRFAVGPDGRFEIEGAPQQGVLRIGAEGFAERRVPIEASDRVLDLGDIQLAHPTPLSIFLEGVSEPAAFAVEGIQGVQLPYTFFDEFGEAAFPANQATDIHLQVTAPDGSYLFVSRTFRPGANSELPIELGAHGLNLLAVDVGDAQLPLQANLELPTGTIVYPFEDGRTAQFQFLPEGEHQLSISDGTGAVVATQIVEVGNGPTTEVRVSLAPDHKIARVWHNGEKLAGAVVYLFRRGEELPLFDGTTGKQGRLALRTTNLGPESDLLATVEHRSLGVATEVPVRRTPEGELEIAPTFDQSLRVTLLDGNEPVSAADVRLTNASGRVLFDQSSTSDVHGLASWPAVGDGEYRVTVLHPGYWPETAHYEPGQHVLQVRALGNLQLELRDLNGNPVEGVAIDVVSHEFGISASQWLEAGAIDATNDDLTTNSEGTFRIVGLPHGDYRIEIDGQILDPNFRVEPGDGNVATLSRP